MRRERSPSEDRGRALGPIWDNPGSQLPGTGVQVSPGCWRWLVWLWVLFGCVFCLLLVGVFALCLFCFGASPVHLLLLHT